MMKTTLLQCEPTPPWGWKRAWSVERRCLRLVAQMVLDEDPCASTCEPGALPMAFVSKKYALELVAHVSVGGVERVVQ